MFLKLLRYEFKNVNKWYLALYGAVITLSIFLAIQMRSIGEITGPYGPPQLFLFLAVTFGALMITLGISTLFLIIRRFKNSVFDRQGYLTLTLPVSEHQILTSKLLAAFIWSTLSSLVFLLSIYIILATVDDTFLYYLNNTGILTRYLDSVPLYLLSLVLSNISGILSIYLSIAIGQLFNEYRVAMAILAYILIHILVAMTRLFLPTLDFTALMVQDSLTNLVLSAIYYLGSYYILKNKVNLQ